ncbi:variant erythrocyte surface antigen-1 family protein [Babesia caballi]|uniref:Variant erythrocyte surface antigen-1 family protein n=1 Tax=Babesia caballi TaxID=5871 RepID=A0AAV4LN14_BABCB|nr:variant erythrocyte surface antigen-1 family protein [Babesia caballi]
MPPTYIPLSAPVDPSFACPSNLKEAINWILRVTGTDGQRGGDGGQAIKALTLQVKGLLQDVQSSGTDLSHQNFENVKKALADGSSNGLITKLAEGLRQFIGYDATGKITGGGILPANVAKHQVCNAVLNFVIRFLEGLSKVNEDLYKQNVLTVIATLRKCVGTGTVPTGFQQLVGKIGDNVGSIDKKVLNRDHGKLKNVFDELKKNSGKLTEHGDPGPKVEANELDNFLNAVDSALQKDNSSNFATYCEKLKELLKNSELTSKAAQDGSALSYGNLKANIEGVTNATPKLNSDIHGINTNTGKSKLIPNAAVFTAVRDAATAFIAEIKEPINYTSYYDEADWKNVSSDNNTIQKCAKIFLGCLPLYYQALTYIYWGCHEKGGGWNAMTLGGGAMKSYFDSQGLLSPYVDTNKRGAHIAESALKKFSEFQQGMAEATSSPSFPYASFNEKLMGLVNSGTNLPNTCSLSALFYATSYYFQCQQITKATSAVSAPKTIREMLYFLAALQFSPQYDAFDGYVTEYFRTMLGKQSDDSALMIPVADSGTSATGNTLSAADLKSHLASTFLLPPSLLGWLQGHSASISDEPWLHSLFSNSQFNLSIPSSAASIFGALSNYTYALQFQLHFLYQQCSNTYTLGCGWQECTFGSNVTIDSVQAHICPTGCNKHQDGNHSQGGCQHVNCGTQDKGSPLQAFLTDKLKSFSRGHPSDPSSHLGSCSGSLCHVPMGFTAENLRAAPGGNTQGENICLTLRAFCGGFNTPLRQLSEKVGCLTKRTPRSLGDMFGFTWHLNSQLFKGGVSADEALKQFLTSIGLDNYSSSSQITPSTFLTYVTQKITGLVSSPKSKGIDKALSMFPGLPFWYNLFMVNPDDSLPVRLFQLKSTDHRPDVPSNYQGKHDDLYSLYNPNCPTNSNKNCGQYLYPLTHSDGATFAPKHASTYLSWVLKCSMSLRILIVRYQGVWVRNVHRTLLEPMAPDPTPANAIQWSSAEERFHCYIGMDSDTTIP